MLLKDEILDYIQGKKLIDFSKISKEDAEKVRRMLDSLNTDPTKFATGRRKPEIPDNVEEIFGKLGMDKTAKGIRRMIHTSTNPDILNRRLQINSKINGNSDFNHFSGDAKDKNRDTNNEIALKESQRYEDHNTPKHQDGGIAESWYNKNIASSFTCVNPKDRSMRVKRKPYIFQDPDDKFNAFHFPDNGIYLTKESKKQPGTVAHEGEHERNYNRGLMMPSRHHGLGIIGEELSASTGANENMREMGISKEERKRENKANAIYLSTYLPDLIGSESPISDYLIDNSKLVKNKKD